MQGGILAKIVPAPDEIFHVAYKEQGGIAFFAAIEYNNEERIAKQEGKRHDV